MPGTFNPKKAAEAQKRYCEEAEVPMVAPGNGLCFHCGRNIYLPTNGSSGAVYGYTVEQAGSRMITGCPHCSFSFLD